MLDGDFVLKGNDNVGMVPYEPDVLREDDFDRYVSTIATPEQNVIERLQIEKLSYYASKIIECLFLEDGCNDVQIHTPSGRTSRKSIERYIRDKLNKELNHILSVQTRSKRVFNLERRLNNILDEIKEFLIKTDFPVRPPQTIEECRHGIRPCPFVDCRYHALTLSSERLHNLKDNELIDYLVNLSETCIMDVLSKKGHCQEDEISMILGIPKEEVSRIIKEHKKEYLNASLKRGGLNDVSEVAGLSNNQ